MRNKIKTTIEIIGTWINLQKILIKKKGGNYPHEKYEKEKWIPVSSCIDRIDKVLDGELLLKIVVPETKYKYGLRLIDKIKTEIKEKLGELK